MLDDATSSGTPPAQTDKTPKPFRISTVFGPGAGQDETDPLLLAQISGTEAVSAPYVFELTILQRTTNDDGSPRDKIEPVKLINTVASFGMSEGENDGQFFNWHDRHGVIDRFEEVGRNPFPEFRCYTARFVPALKLLERERTFRIFENIDALAAIRSVFQAQGEIPSDYLIVNLSAPLPKLPYIVQFGEDSLSFVHRLLAMHGIWYHFVHELGRKTERMVLGDGKKQHPTDQRPRAVHRGRARPLSCRRLSARVRSRASAHYFGRVQPATAEVAVSGQRGHRQELRHRHRRCRA